MCTSQIVLTLFILVLTVIKKQQLETVTSESEARAKGFAQGDTFKLLKHDFVLLTEAESKTAKEQRAKEAAAAAKLS